MPDRDRERLFTEPQVRAAFVAAFAGMVAVLVVLLILASVRPQGRHVAADRSQFDATLRSASADLEGFELVGEERARLDIDHAMELVAERGVGLQLVELDAAEAQMAAGEDGDGEAADGEAAAEADGESVYAANCAACHQANGQGVPGAFPPLAGNLVELVGLEGGREYLIHAVLHGVQGEMEVGGQSYDGVMPAWGQLSDAEIAAVLHHEMTAWDEGALPDGFEPIAAEEVADLRDEDLGPGEVLELRPER